MQATNQKDEKQHKTKEKKKKKKKNLSLNTLLCKTHDVMALQLY